MEQREEKGYTGVGYFHGVQEYNGIKGGGKTLKMNSV